eukprot:CAMPEP_0177282916 /NCGR_PEP_ID=MMETSP0367-20130122/71719_1 /TAXON_ID=447022 ORGANISM="Scrippsiella hangoei-like, Strain SHHI-4" /NCGR_SAMPLE_ID=MMETSP0367 /ASSEMBLY_ACC=CAM_ASM_000362 /LENGTH=41 /DNA_ID= /DNA_START= /DNA_END= /DNA_ORIENTATION=
MRAVDRGSVTLLTWSSMMLKKALTSDMRCSGFSMAGIAGSE